MTKPTYSELEAENLRVRGLLQRSLNTIANAANDLTVLGKDRPEAMTIALDLMKALTTEGGAESADIGKLDAADEKVAEFQPCLTCDSPSRCMRSKSCADPI